MKATGIVRRVDDLGRISIPRDIRRSLNIKEGEPLEFYINEEFNALYLRKYKVQSSIKEQLEAIIEWYGEDLPPKIISMLNSSITILKEKEGE